MLAVLNQRLNKHFRRTILRIRNRFKKNIDATEYYFGYGANLDTSRFKNNHMIALEVGNATLMDYEIKFSLPTEYIGKSYAGVHERAQSQVPGVLVRIDKLSLYYLDALEWCGFGAYERKLINVECDNRPYKAWTYIVKSPDFSRLPSKIYLNNMIKTAKIRKFGEEYINYLEAQESKEMFEIDYSFSLWTYSSSRKFVNLLLPFYKAHDKIREKICSII